MVAGRKSLVDKQTRQGPEWGACLVQPRVMIGGSESARRSCCQLKGMGTST